MKFDLTKEAVLGKESQEKYFKLRLTLHLAFLVLFLGLGYVIIFPSAQFYFSFDPSDNSIKNTLSVPRDSDGSPLENGLIPDNSPSFFDAALFGNYSRANITLSLDNDSELLDGSSLTVRKSYQAFLYPESEPIGFRDGTLLENDGRYYIISNGSLRQFASQSVWEGMGFRKEGFWSVSQKDLRYNPEDPSLITSFQSYPDDSLFHIGETYYILRDKKLRPYISEKAFLSSYRPEQAIEKDENFLSNFDVSENQEGFSDGTLISYGVSAYIVSEGKILPINNVNTFVSMGYSWDDIIAVGGDEFSLYPKDKLFTISSVHPSGTIFDVAENSDWRMVQDRRSVPLPTEIIARSWIVKKTPILITEESLKTSVSCRLEQSSFSQKRYGCEIILESLKNISGKDYEFKLEGGENVMLDSVQVVFKKNPTWENFKLAGKSFLGRISSNYVSE